MKIAVAILAVLFILIPATAKASASPQLKLDVMPLDCVFENINNGLNQIRFLTPRECGQIEISNPNPTTNLQPLTSVDAGLKQIENPGALVQSEQVTANSTIKAKPINASFSLSLPFNIPRIAIVGLAGIGTIALVVMVDIKFFGYGYKILKFIVKLVTLVIK